MSDKPLLTSALDALDAICEAVAGVAFLTEYKELPERLRCTGTRWSSDFAGALNHTAAWVKPPPSKDGKSRHASVSVSQRELLIRWLRSSGFSADAVELDERLKGLLSNLRKWEDKVCTFVERKRIDIQPTPDLVGAMSLYDWVGRAAVEELNDIIDEASGMFAYCRQLAVTLRERMPNPDHPEDENPLPVSPKRRGQRTAMPDDERRDDGCTLSQAAKASTDARATTGVVKWLSAVKATGLANRLTFVDRDWSSYWRSFCNKHEVLTRPARTKAGVPTKQRREVEIGSLIRIILQEHESFDKATTEDAKRRQAIMARLKAEHGIDPELRDQLMQPD